MYKVEKSKEDTWEPRKLRSRNFSMTSEEFWSYFEIINLYTKNAYLKFLILRCMFKIDFIRFKMVYTS